MHDAYRAQLKSINGDQLSWMRANICAWSADDCIDEFMEDLANTRVSDKHDAILTLCHLSSCQQALLDVAVQTSSENYVLYSMSINQ